MRSIILATLLVLIYTISLFPRLVGAKVIMSEVMYDLDGSDSGREWVEVHNTGADSVDIADWRLSENGVNHKLNAVSGSGVLAPDGYAIIADNADKFLNDWASYTGMLFDSSFSLSNTGEQIILRDAELNDVDSVSYSLDIGGSGDGTSIQYNSGGGYWGAGHPTPGGANKIQASTNGGASNNSANVEPTGSPEGGGSASIDYGGNPSYDSDNKKIRAEIDAPERAVVGADFVVSGRGYGFKGEPLSNARYIWNLGDGTVREGRSIRHSYSYPGAYVVVLSLGSGEFSASARLTITAKTANIILSEVGTTESGFIEIESGNDFDIDISGWHLSAGMDTFSLPQGTVLMRHTKVKFSADTTALVVDKKERVLLMYPNGTIAHEYMWSDRQSTSVTTANVSGNNTQYNLQAVVPANSVAYTAPASVGNTPKEEKIINRLDAVDNALTETVEEELSSKGSNQNQLATPLTGVRTDKESLGSIWPWLLGLMAVVGIGTASSITMRRYFAASPMAGARQYSVGGYEVIED